MFRSEYSGEMNLSGRQQKHKYNQERRKMKKIMTLIAVVGMAFGISAADAIYKGSSADEAICYYKSRKFYSDADCKNMIFNHPGSEVGKEATIPYGKALYKLSGGRIYKGASANDKNACIATIVETKTKRGDIVEAKIYKGYVIARDMVEQNETGSVKTITSYNLSADGVNVVPMTAIYTIKDNKMYRGESTDDKDCVLNWKGTFNGARLLFMAVEFAK